MLPKVKSSESLTREMVIETRMIGGESALPTTTTQDWSVAGFLLPFAVTRPVSVQDI